MCCNIELYSVVDRKPVEVTKWSKNKETESNVHLKRPKKPWSPARGIQPK